MTPLIQDKNKDPLGSMLCDYLGGNPEAFLNVWSSTLEMSTMTGATMCRNYAAMNEMEKSALAACHGRVLDVGAGAGCHSLVLQARDLEIEAIDISPGCVEVMRRRGVAAPSHRNVFALDNSSYDTILMLMNGIGICSTLNGLNLFLQQLDRLLAPGGQLLTDSTDLTPTFTAKGEATYNDDDGYCGETDFVMIYRGMRSDPFGWLYIDFGLLATICGFHGFLCEKLMETQGNQYLARIARPSV